jgi:CDGSH-type Zn-finger protein
LFMAEVTIEARPNGPYVVTGTIELRDTNGNVLPTQARTVLCRCGASTKKPFCDGTHSKIGFQAAAQAVPDSAESAADSGGARVSAGNVAVPAAALDAAESEGVISGVANGDRLLLLMARLKTPGGREMPQFRYYCLYENGKIASGEHIDVAGLAAATRFAYDDCHARSMGHCGIGSMVGDGDAIFHPARARDKIHAD